MEEGGAEVRYTSLRRLGQPATTPSPVYYVDQKPVDAWTLVHAGFGLSAGLVGAPMLLTLAGTLFWEALENWRRPRTTFATMPNWTPEVDLNAVVDILVALGAWGVGMALATRKR